MHARVAGLDWERLAAELDRRGRALTGPLLLPEECGALTQGWDDEGAYRTRVVMDRHGFGQGEYRYYRYPLPRPVEELRAAFYSELAPIANRWGERLGEGTPYPASLDGLLERCREAGQERPTPLILHYARGDYNRLHQDLYGDVHFPLQLAVLLTRPGRDHRGGEFVLTEQRPRMQSRVEVVPLRQGEGVVFPVEKRPVEGKRGTSRATMRHGVSEVRAGHRYTLGVIFHDAR
ncbi:MAG: proline hydroxylase [Deltaproteobacteria bacterium]|nr:proline hydroxylase [Deltaproteobacteria bacterium]